MLYSRQSFGIVISRLRTRKGITQEVMSGRIGISRSHLAMLENGKRIPKLDTVWKISDAFGIAPSTLIHMTERE